MTAGDLEYIQKNVNQIQEFKCNLKNGLTYEDKKGAQSTVFPGWTFSEKASLTTVELGGFTDIGSYAFWKTKNLTSVKIEDAQIIKASAFSGAEKCNNLQRSYDCVFLYSKNHSSKQSSDKWIKSLLPPLWQA